VRLQTSNQYRNAFDCAARIAREEGLLAFYKVDHDIFPLFFTS
jgi:hypothetical protein